MLSCLFSNNMAQGSAKIGKCCGSSVVEHSLGKGEVESSILSRSTMTFHSAPLSLISHHLPNIFSPHHFPTTPCWLLIFFVHLQAQCIFKHNAFLLHACRPRHICSSLPLSQEHQPQTRSHPSPARELRVSPDGARSFLPISTSLRQFCTRAFPSIQSIMFVPQNNLSILPLSKKTYRA